MNSELQKLMNMLACVSCSGHQAKRVTIHEDNKRTELGNVVLEAGYGDWFVFTPDEGRGEAKRMSSLLADGPGLHHHSACDAVIVRLIKDEIWFLFVELKSNFPRGYETQFKSTRQFARYLWGLFHEFHSPTLSPRALKEQFVVFHTTIEKPSMRKTETMPKSKRTAPETPLKIIIQNGETRNLDELLF